MNYLVKVVIVSTAAICLQSCGPRYVSPPPVAVIEVRPAMPYPNAIWIDGGWGWRNGRHYQRQGYYTQPRANMNYRQGEWRQTPRGHHYIKGGWKR